MSRRHFAAHFSVCAFLFAMAATGASADPLSRGRLLFLRCASCHDVSKSPSAKIGPNLYGVVGRRAGSLAGYGYSPAMKAQTFVWTDAMLNRWLTKPTELVPGTAMAFSGVPDEADRAAIIAFLKTAGTAP
jgi:cytochrome c